MVNKEHSVESRKCSKCRLSKALTEYGEDGRSKDGVSRVCDECRFSGSRADYVRNADTYRERTRAWQAANPERVAQYRADNVDRRRELARRRYAGSMTDEEKREAYNEYHRKYRAANREKIKGISARFYERAKVDKPDQLIDKRCKRREREAAAGTLNAEIRKAVFHFYGSSCYLCNGSATEVDHHQPLAAGGQTELVNLRPVCAPCNLRKGPVWPFDEAELRGRILAEYAADRPSEVA